MADLTKQQVKHTAFLARIALTDEEIDKFYTQIGSFLKNAEKMNEIDTSNVEETSQVTGIENVLRDDIANPSMDQKDAISNAPETKDGSIKMPKYHDN